MSSREAIFQKRLEEYKRLLQKNGLSKTVSYAAKSLSKQRDLDDYDLIFLYVFAPAICLYSEWITNLSLKMKDENLGFLSRDGYLPKIATDRIITKRNLPLKTEYIKVSRYSLRRAEYYILKDKATDLLCAGALRVTPAGVLGRLGLPPTDIEALLLKLGYDKTYFDKQLSRKELSLFRDKLAGYENLSDIIEKTCKEPYYEAKEYLDGKNVTALVDSGWNGTMLRSIKRITGTNIRGYYFGLFEIPKDMESEDYYSFYFSPKGDFRKKVHFANSLLEVICSSPDGSTIGYKYGEAIESACDNKVSERQLKNKEILELFSNKYLEDFPESGITGDAALEFIYGLFSRLMGNPVMQEASALGMEPFCDDVLEEALYPIARDIKNVGFIEPKIRHSAWPQGSIRLYGNRVQLPIENVIGYLRFAKKEYSHRKSKH